MSCYTLSCELPHDHVVSNYHSKLRAPFATLELAQEAGRRLLRLAAEQGALPKYPTASAMRVNNQRVFFSSRTTRSEWDFRIADDYVIDIDEEEHVVIRYGLECRRRVTPRMIRETVTIDGKEYHREVPDPASIEPWHRIKHESGAYFMLKWSAHVYGLRVITEVPVVEKD
jgi:hypothetical protein